jgi:DNA recombination protein Rad52
LPIHDIVETANRIFGFGGWQREIRRLEKVYQDETEGVYSVGYLCEYRVRVGDIVHEDVGFGSSSNQPDLAQAHEMAVKGAVSDAIKRCFRAFGDQFGLSLYKKHEFEEEAVPSGPRAATEAQLGRLRKTLRAHNLKEEALLEYIKAKMGSEFSRLEDLPLKVASRAIERFTQDETAFVKEIQEIAAGR